LNRIGSGSSLSAQPTQRGVQDACGRVFAPCILLQFVATLTDASCSTLRSRAARFS
jgi:hypothetical protein